MNPQLDIPYGQLPQSGRFSKLISRAQAAPHNWVGRKYAKACRRIVLSKVESPVDAEVEGIRMRTLLLDNNSERRYLFMPWLFDAEERHLLAKAVPGDGVFVDIGANVGIYSLWMAKHMNREGRILCFEPNPPAYQRLQFNMFANRAVHELSWPQVHCIPKGVSDQAGEFVLHLDPNNLGGSSLVMHKESGAETRVSCISLLEQLQLLDIDKIDALKIDIEGAEDIALLPFFAEAPRVLYPKLIVMERTHLDSKTPLDSALQQAGYKALKLTRMNAVYALG